jgi:hypothetical protein
MKKIFLTLVFMAASSVFCQNIEVYKWNSSYRDYLPSYTVQKDYFGNAVIKDYMTLEPLYEIRQSYGSSYDVFKYENFLPSVTPIITFEDNSPIINFDFK